MIDSAVGSRVSEWIRKLLLQLFVIGAEERDEEFKLRCFEVEWEVKTRLAKYTDDTRRHEGTTHGTHKWLLCLYFI